jgi:hypothetical protein
MTLQKIKTNNQLGIFNAFRQLEALGSTQKLLKATSYGLQSLSIEEAVEIAPSGAPIYFPMKFIGGTYKAYDKHGQLVDVAIGDMRLPVVHLATFDRSKIVAITDIGSGRGSVKEVDGHTDWKIELTGIITDEKGNPNGNETCREMIESLSQFENSVSSIEVASELLTMLGIYKVFIAEASISQVVGTHDEFEFSLSMLSDEEFELEIVA